MMSLREPPLNGPQAGARRSEEVETDGAKRVVKERTAARQKALDRKWRNVPEAWDDARDSLATLFETQLASGRRFLLETPATADLRTIDLGDPVSF